MATTQIYTRVSIKKLKDIHTATHPSARLERRPSSPSPSSNGERPVEADADAEREALLSSLAAERDEEDEP